MWSVEASASDAVDEDLSGPVSLRGFASTQSARPGIQGKLVGNAMMRTRLLVAFGACALALGCSSKVSSFLDPELQKRVVALQECFPPLWDKVEQLLLLFAQLL